VLSRLHRGSRPEAPTEASCKLLAGIGGFNFGWEAAPDQRRPFVHLVFTGASPRLAGHAGMGAADDIAIAATEAYSASSWILDMPE